MKVDLQFHLTATLCATGGFVKNTLSALHCLFFIICSSFLSFSCSKRISLVIIYQLHKQKSSFSSFFFFCVEGRETLKLPEETRRICHIKCLLCDVNDGSVVAGGVKVMNNSYCSPVLVDEGCFKSQSYLWGGDWMVDACGGIGAAPSAVWCYFGVLKCVIRVKQHNYSCWCRACWLQRIRTENTTSITARLFYEGDFWCRVIFDSWSRRRRLRQSTSE